MERAPERVDFGLSMLGWALNEEENIAGYIDRAGELLQSVSNDFELIVIDDGSSDRTWQIMEQYSRTRPWLRVFRNEVNRGSGYNTKRAISLASKDYLFWQTVDWAYDIELLMQALPELRRVDVLQGVRLDTMSPNGVVRRRSDTPYKGMVSVINYRLIRMLFQVPLRDYQNVTVYPRELIQSISLETESAFTNPECLLKAWWRGATFKEVTVPFVKRQRGRGTGTRPQAIVAAVLDIVRWWTTWILLGRRADRGQGRVVR